MSKTYTYYKPESARSKNLDFVYNLESEETHPYKLMQWMRHRNPSNSYRRVWRRRHRAKANQMLRSDRARFNKFEDLQVPNKIWETSSIYDWY
jgi:hypothetical protein